MSTVWIQRDNEEAKSETKDVLRQRSSEPGWPQLLIFPEGTTTNGSQLVIFRTGAFAAGQPVQPVTLQRRLGQGDSSVGWTDRRGGQVDSVGWTERRGGQVDSSVGSWWTRWTERWSGQVDTVTWSWVQRHRVLTLVILTLMTPVTFIGQYLRSLECHWDISPFHFRY